MKKIKRKRVSVPKATRHDLDEAARISNAILGNKMTNTPMMQQMIMKGRPPPSRHEYPSGSMTSTAQSMFAGFSHVI